MDPKALLTGAISCKLCASSFHLSERAQYAAKGWEAPKACPPCRKLRPPVWNLPYAMTFEEESVHSNHADFPIVPIDISLPMTRPSKPNLSIQSCPFSGPALRTLKAAPGIIECVTPVSILLSWQRKRIGMPLLTG